MTMNRREALRQLGVVVAATASRNRRLGAEAQPRRPLPSREQLAWQRDETPRLFRVSEDPCN